MSEPRPLSDELPGQPRARAGGTTVGKVAAVALKALGFLTLTIATLYVGAYFALASTPGRDVLRGLVSDALGPFARDVPVGDVHWGPAPGELWAAGIVLATPVGSLDVKLVRGRVAVPSLAVDALEIWIGKAQVTLPPPPTEPPVVASASAGTRTGTRPKNAPTLPDVRVIVDEVDFTMPGAALHARDVRVSGAVGETVRVEVTTGACHATWMNGRRVSGWDHCVVAGSMQGRVIDLARLVLARGDSEVAHVRGRVELPSNEPVGPMGPPASTGPTGQLVADLDLGPWDAAVLAGDQLPLGLVAQGVIVRLEGELVSGSIAALHAPLVRNGPFIAELVSLEVPRYTGEAGLIVPRVSLTARGLVASHAEALDWSVDGVSAPLITFDLEKKLIGELPGVRIDMWRFPGGAIGPVTTDADVAIGISGGSIEGLVVTPAGILFANGRLKVSPISKRSSFVASADFDDLRVPLVGLIMHDCGVAEHDALAGGPDQLLGPLGGHFEVAVELERESRVDPWELTLEWDATRLVGKAALAWDGSEWGPAGAPGEPGENDERDP